MNTYPAHWKIITLAQVCQNTRNKTVNPLNYPEETFEYYSIPAYQEHGKPVAEKGAKILSNKILVANNTVLFGKLNPRVLKVWLVASTSSMRKIATTEFLPILVNTSAESEYIFYLCQSGIIVEESARLVTGSTPSRERVDPNAFYQLPIPLPPLSEQRAIAATLQTVHNSRIARRNELALERERKAALMEDLFTCGVRGEPCKQTEIGPMPESWQITRLGSLCTIVRGASPRPRSDPKYYGGNIPRLLIADVTRDGKWVSPAIDFLTEEGAKMSRPMPCGSMVISLSGTVGVPCFLAMDACIHDGFVGFRNMSTTINADFLYFQILQRRNELVALAPHGSIFKNLTTDVLKNFSIIMPPFAEQRDIADALTACDRKIAALEAEATLHDELFQALLEELMTGRLSTLPLVAEAES